LWARQLGKTTLIENLCGYIIDVDPGNIFVKYPTRTKAADFSQKKLADDKGNAEAP
jgi:phage terminase large subunit GpA-like protein